MTEQKPFLGIFLSYFFPYSRAKKQASNQSRKRPLPRFHLVVSLSISRNDPPPRGVGDGSHAHRRVPHLADGVGLAERPHRRARAARRDLRRQEEGHAGIIQAVEAGHGGEVRLSSILCLKSGRGHFPGLK